MTLQRMLLLLLTLMIGATSLPFGSEDPTSISGTPEASLLRALHEWNTNRADSTKTIRAKGEMDRLLVHRHLFDGLTPNYFVPLQNCFAGKCPSSHRALEVLISNSSQRACACVQEEDYLYVYSIKEVGTSGKVPYHKILEAKNNNFRRAETFDPSSKDTNFTYVPPPKTDITPELLDQSLASQPQDTATVVSIMAHFQEGTISFGAQLNGIVAATMTLNASTELPCDGIGGQTQPDLELRPKDVDNGTVQTYIPDCQIIAVNMYNPDVINYWVLDNNGSMYSLVGSNKIVQLNRLNSTASISLVLRAKYAGWEKRDLSMRDCGMAGHGIARRALERNEVKRGLSVPDSHTASMTAEACAGMKCNNIGGQPAIFNPLTSTCWCRDPVYVETDHSA